MERNKTTQEKVLHRLKIARGHLGKVIKMVEDQDYCIDVIHQSQAVQKALKEVDSVVLHNHLHTCVQDAFKSGKTDTAIEEVMEVFKRTT